MSTISIDDVKHLADLSGLRLADSEIGSLRDDLGNIIDYFGQLKELDTEGVEPTYQVNPLENVWRDDIVELSQISREDLLALAPESLDNSVKVPKVL
ncbi:MAG: Asp-tRNA(Asn)/Glu-tRNA(Gln) amidotransferase subunit GatC [Candidatus Saccharimonas sp.]